MIVYISFFAILICLFLFLVSKKELPRQTKIMLLASFVIVIGVFFIYSSMIQKQETNTRIIKNIYDRGDTLTCKDNIGGDINITKKLFIYIDGTEVFIPNDKNNQIAKSTNIKATTCKEAKK